MNEKNNQKESGMCSDLSLVFIIQTCLWAELQSHYQVENKDNSLMSSFNAEKKATGEEMPVCSPLQTLFLGCSNTQLTLTHCDTWPPADLWLRDSAEFWEHRSSYSLWMRREMLRQMLASADSLGGLSP